MLAPINIGYSTNTSGFSAYTTHVHTIFISHQQNKQTLMEAKIYFQTDIFSDPKLQRSKHSSNCARSSEQQDILSWCYESFSKDKCLNRCNILFAKSQVEDCLELNLKHVDYQTLAHLSYSSCVCWTSVHATRAQCFLSVGVSISGSIYVNIFIGDSLASFSALSLAFENK